MTPKLTPAREAEIRALLTDPHRAVCSFEYAAQVAARELLDELTRLRDRLAEARSLIAELDPGCICEAGLIPDCSSCKARRFLNERPQEEP